MANPKRRAQIAEAAMELFDERGYHATGMEDIASAVGMRASSLYNHYGSKQEVLADIAISSMEALLRFHATGYSPMKTSADKLFASMKYHTIFHAEQARRARIVNSEIRALQEPSRSIVVQMRRDYVARWMAIVREGIDSGVFVADDVKIVSWALIDMGIGVSQWYAEGGRLSSEELGDMYGRIALRQLCKPGTDPYTDSSLNTRTEKEPTGETAGSDFS